MPDSSIPPNTTPPQAAQPSTAQQAPAQNIIAQQVPVQSAPPNLQNPQPPVQVSGTVANTNTAAGTITISTDQGTITLATPLPLAANTPVSLTLSIQQGTLVATVSTRAPAQQTPTQNTAQPPNPEVILPPPDLSLPQLQEGDTVTAYKIPPVVNTPPPEQPQGFVAGAPVTSLKNIITALNTLDAKDIQSLPHFSTLPEDLQQFLNAAGSGKENVFETLTPRQGQELLRFLTKPDVFSALKNLLPDDALPKDFLSTASSSRAAPLAATSAQEPDIAHILSRIFFPETAQKMPRAGKTAINSASSSDASPAPSSEPARAATRLSSLLKTLLPLLEHDDAPLSPSLLRGLSKPSATARLSPDLYQIKIIRLPDATQQTASKTGKAPIPQNIAAPPEDGTTRVQGKIITTSPAGFPVVETQNKDIFVLQARLPANLALGSSVTLDIAPFTQEQMIAGLTAALKTNDAQTTRGAATLFPALQEALSTLEDAAPAQTAAALRNTLPTATPRLTATTLLFLAALRGGDAGNWLGQNALQALAQAGKKDLADNIRKDFSQLSAQSKNILPGNWRSVSVPLLHDQNLHALQFHVRQQQDESAGEGDGSGRPKKITRFIVDLKLSRMGGMQIDGLLHKKRLDVILRTQDKLPNTMRREVMQAFSKGLEQANLQGEIGFQTRQESWVKIEEPRQGLTA